MICFYADGKNLIKVIDQGSDLQVLSNTSTPERWFSTWSQDYKGSVLNAILSTAKDAGLKIKESDIEWC